MTNLKTVSGQLTGKKYKPGMNFCFDISIPEADVSEYALLIEHDCLNEANVNSMLTLAEEGKAPYCVNIGVRPGSLAMPNGTERWMRMNSYDLFDREFADFIVYELIPYIAKTYEIRFSDSPDMHAVSGGSSGGISAFLIAWFHPEYFHRVYMASPSFLAMARGNEIPYLIRKYETKPLRVYEEYSENEPNDYFGASYWIDGEACAALRFAQYDFHCEFFPGEGHSSRYRNVEEAYKRNEWIWKDWDTKPVTVLGNSPRVSRVIPAESKWEPCEQFPERARELLPAALSSSFDRVIRSAVGDAWYAGNRNDDTVRMFPAADSVSADKGFLHAALHTIPRICPLGTIDLAVDKGDRLYVLTAIGIQCVRSFGLIDVILDLPDTSAPLELAVTDALYVKTENGVYKRSLCPECVAEGDAVRKFVGYYD